MFGGNVWFLRGGRLTKTLDSKKLACLGDVFVLPMSCSLVSKLLAVCYELYNK